MNQRGLLLIVLLAAVFVLYLSARQQEPQALPEDIQAQNKYYLKDFVTSSFDQAGELQRIVRGQTLKQSSQTKETTIEAPRIELFEQDTPRWIISAQNAWLDARQEHARLTGNVIAKQQPASGSELRTAELEVDFPEQTAHTASSVFITQGQNSIEGVGLRANLPAGTLEILAKVRGVYVP